MLATIVAAWLQYAADGKPHARAVVSGACPAVVVDGRPLPMRERAHRSSRFADVVCDVAVEAGAKRVRIGGRELPAPAHEPRTIAVLGDTGCRISLAQVQACNDPNEWPFPLTALAIAAAHPDLIVHVGDYLYRERACPIFARCADSPHGDDAAAWYADFLTPAAPMFAAAPLMLMRGNHEECGRNGAGWFRYLDPHAAGACSENTAPYAVDLGDLRLVGFDSAIAEDHGVDAAREPAYRRQFAAVKSMLKPGEEAWFVTHRPPYTNADERVAMDGALAAFDAVLAGHIHFFAAMNVATLPPLVINGEGGTKLEPNYAALLAFAVGDLHVEGDVFGSSHHGFALYTRTPAGWAISLRNPDGSERARCSLAHRSVTCTGDTK